jgi:hypothetical protein
MLLTREQILEAKDIQTKEIEVPEWGGKLRIKQLSAKEYNDIEMSQFNIKKMRAKQLSQSGNVNIDLEEVINDNAIKNQKIMLIVKSCVDENMKPLFTEADIELLASKNVNVVEKVVAEIVEFNDATAIESKKN